LKKHFDIKNDVRIIAQSNKTKNEFTVSTYRSSSPSSCW